MQWLNYHHLYYFYVIACEGGITEATKKLRLAQSTLSTQLKKFEDIIGYSLFERKNRKLTLTDVGKRVFEYAHEIFSLGEELRNSLVSFEDSLKDSITLGIMDSIPKKLGRKIVDLITKEHGRNTTITIIEESLPTLCTKLENHKIDLILANDKPPNDDQTSKFYHKLVGELQVDFVTTSSLLELRKDYPRSLNDKPMIMPGKNSQLRNEVIDYLRIKHLQPRIIAEVDDLELQKMLVIDGHGFTALPLMAAEEELRSGKLVRLSETPICHENLWLISAHRLVNNPISKMLFNTFRSH
ncbi:MAG: LysR substrate-binding domain-containing protein [Bdellovibrionota bacterium]